MSTRCRLQRNADLIHSRAPKWHSEFLTQHGLRSGAGAQQRREAQVADLHDALRAIDEDVVAPAAAEHTLHRQHTKLLLSAVVLDQWISTITKERR